jgi:predicted nucleic acid-binding protein
VIVLDSSAAVDLLTRRNRWAGIGTAVASAAGVAVPGHWRVECVSALARLERDDAAKDRLDAVQAAGYERAIEALDRLRVEVVPVTAAAMWYRREDLRVSDASYVALARTLGATLVTSDARLARAPRLDCDVQSFAGTG